MVEYPLNCYSSVGDGFSGWYAVSDRDSCKDFCFWSLDENGGGSLEYTSSNTANPHERTIIPGIATWRCAMDVSDDATTWESARNSSLSNTGAFGERFEFLRCNRNAKESLHGRADKIESSYAFWLVAVLVLIAVACFESYYFFRRYTRKAQPIFRILESAPAAYPPDSDMSSDIVEGEDGVVRTTYLDTNMRLHISTAMSKMKKGFVIVLFLVVNALLLWLFIVSILSLIEVGGHSMTSSESRLTPACSNPQNECVTANSDIDRPSSSLSVSKPFSYLVASDAQLDWYAGESATAGLRDVPLSCSPTDSCQQCTRKTANYTNHQLRKAFEVLLLNQENSDFSTNTLVMNGDLTAYFHPKERNAYESIYHNIQGLENFFPSLGNHDYSQGEGARYNLDQWPWGEATCNGKHAIGYVKSGICGRIPLFHPKRIVRYDARSLAYSWEEGRYHFVHLHYFPTFENAKLGIRNSLQWLERDLSLAHAEDMTSIIFAHSAQGMTHTVEQAMAGKNVAAIFAGHSHRCLHRKCTGPRVLREHQVNDPNSTIMEKARKCVPAGMAVCSGVNAMSVVYMEDISNNLTRPDRKIYVYRPSANDDSVCPLSSPAFVNETDNTLWCVQGTSYRSEFPIFHNGNVTEKIPIFWSGSSSYETFLRADFYSNKIVINALTATAGNEGERYIDVNNIPNPVYPHHDGSDLEEVTIDI